MVEKKKSFIEIYQTFLSRQEMQHHDPFTAAINVWLQFDITRVCSIINQKAPFPLINPH